MTDHPNRSAGSEEVPLEKLQELQQLAGIPHLPTQFTYVMRLAVAREGPRAYDWSDKPHRLVYDLCREIERMSDVAQPAMDLERQALEQIKTVCVDNAAPSCKHRMALDFVRQIASDCLAAQPPAAPVECPTCGGPCKLSFGGAVSVRYDENGKAHHRPTPPQCSAGNGDVRETIAAALCAAGGNGFLQDCVPTRREAYLIQADAVISVLPQTSGMREALEPFARLGAPDCWPDHPNEFVVCSFRDEQVTIGDLRKANATLAMSRPNSRSGPLDTLQACTCTRMIQEAHKPPCPLASHHSRTGE